MIGWPANTYNEFDTGSVYPASGGSTGSGGSYPQAAQGVSSGIVNPVTSNPIAGLAIFVVLVAIVYFLIHWLARGEAGEFANIKASFVNVLLISLTAVLGIPIVKGGFAMLAKVGIPGADHANAYVQAA